MNAITLPIKGMMNPKVLTTGLATAFVALVAPATALAQLGGGGGGTNTLNDNSRVNPSGDANFTGATGLNVIGLANTILNTATLLIGIIAVFFLIYSGFQYITAGGDAEKVKKARAGIVNAVIGIIIVVAAFFIIRFAIGIGNQVTA